jgi:aspartate carbamoyltransferase catalytic subunit
MNRGVEIGSEVADDIDRSLIRQQVEMGVAVRMACLDVLMRRNLPTNAPANGGAAPRGNGARVTRRKPRR